MPRFFLQDIYSKTISGDDAKHISRVLRMKKGDEITVCDLNATDYTCRISDFSKTEVFFDIISQKPSETESDVKFSVFQALPKASKMDYIIQKCTELGVYEIFPVALSRCIVKLDGADAKKKTERWQAVSEAAAKQSMRGIVPKIHMPLSFKETILKLKEADLCFVCYENEKDTTLKNVLQSAHDNIKSVAFLIGPEGGISEAEISAIKDAGIAAVSLGKRILRTETAPTAVLAAINYEFDK